MPDLQRYPEKLCLITLDIHDFVYLNCLFLFAEKLCLIELDIHDFVYLNCLFLFAVSL